MGIILVETDPQANVPAVTDDIWDLLRTRHRLQPPDEDNLTIRTLDDSAQTIAGASRTMLLMLMSIASISLVVGGISIMNILQVSITERTRETGLRMTVGAMRAYILFQLLIEAMITTTVGDLLGVATSVGIARLLTAMIGWPTIINSRAVAVSFLSSLALGLFFGLYPAYKASKLNPLAPMRYE